MKRSGKNKSRSNWGRKKAQMRKMQEQDEEFSPHPRCYRPTPTTKRSPQKGYRG